MATKPTFNPNALVFDELGNPKLLKKKKKKKNFSYKLEV